MSDVMIPLRIPSAKVADAKAGFLKMNPVPADRMVDPKAGATNQEQLAWVKFKIRNWFAQQCNRGLQKLASEAANVPFDNEIVHLDD